jgi:hypothetical protein
VGSAKAANAKDETKAERAQENIVTKIRSAGKAKKRKRRGEH